MRFSSSVMTPRPRRVVRAERCLLGGSRREAMESTGKSPRTRAQTPPMGRSTSSGENIGHRRRGRWPQSVGVDADDRGMTLRSRGGSSLPPDSPRRTGSSAPTEPSLWSRSSPSAWPSPHFSPWPRRAARAVPVRHPRCPLLSLCSAWSVGSHVALACGRTRPIACAVSARMNSPVCPTASAFALSSPTSSPGGTADAGVTLLLIDIDGFQIINETVGRERGDLVLERVGKRLAGRIRDGDIVGRIGGDEFAIAVDGLSSGADLARVAYRFLGVMTEAVQIDEIELDVRCSVGICRFPDDADDAVGLLQRADIALYAAKQNRSVIEVYEPSLDHFSLDALELAAEVGAGIAENQFALEYQPRTAVASGELTGFEAILRWNHPSRGRVPPASFMAAAAALPVSRELTHHVLGLATEQASAWREAGLGFRSRSTSPPATRSMPGCPESSPICSSRRPRAASPRAPGHRRRPARQPRSGPRRTRRTPARRLPRHRRWVRHRRRQHERSIDAPRRRPEDQPGTIARMADDPRAEAVVCNAVDLGHALGLEVIGEGIEADATRSAVAGAGCDTAQGYGVEGPLPPDEIARRFAGDAAWAPAPAIADPTP